MFIGFCCILIVGFLLAALLYKINKLKEYKGPNMDFENDYAYLGQQDYMEGKQLDDNPYTVIGSFEYEEWKKGWQITKAFFVNKIESGDF